MQLDYTKALQILDKSTVIFNKQQLVAAIDDVAMQIENDIVDEIPLFLTVMNGGMFFAAELLKRIGKPLINDYIHASRYGNQTFGSHHITWHRQPKDGTVKDRLVIVLDDILDEGYTLLEIKRTLLEAGAKDCKTAVLINKLIDKEKPITADYVCLNAPNKFLFGFGMDIFDCYRQLPQIYAYEDNN